MTNEELRKISLEKEKKRTDEDDGSWEFWVDDATGEKHYE